MILNSHEKCNKDYILAVVVLLAQKLKNRTGWSERFLTVQNLQLASDQKPESAQDWAEGSCRSGSRGVGATPSRSSWAPSAAALHLVDREAVRWSRATRSLKNDERNFALNDGIVQLQWVSTVNRKHVVWCSTSKSNTDRVLRSHLDVVVYYIK